MSSTFICGDLKNTTSVQLPIYTRLKKTDLVLVHSIQPAGDLRHQLRRDVTHKVQLLELRGSQHRLELLRRVLGAVDTLYSHTYVSDERRRIRNWELLTAINQEFVPARGASPPTGSPRTASRSPRGDSPAPTQPSCAISYAWLSTQNTMSVQVVELPIRE